VVTEKFLERDLNVGRPVPCLLEVAGLSGAGGLRRARELRHRVPGIKRRPDQRSGDRHADYRRPQAKPAHCPPFRHHTNRFGSIGQGLTNSNQNLA
jgi:hypothetical protein